MAHVSADVTGRGLGLPAEVEARLRDENDRRQGWCTADKAVRLAELVLEAARRFGTSACDPPLRSVDLGVFGARSTVALAVGHALVGGCVLGVDPWATAPALAGVNHPDNDAWWAAVDLEAVYRQAIVALQCAVPKDTWQIVRATSADARPSVPDRAVAVLHQDSNHSEAVSSAELDLWTSALRPGGIWVMDDTDWPTLQVTQYRLKKEFGYTLVEDHTQWRVFQAPA